MSTAELLPQYIELQELGQGAQGRVVLARHTGSSELVAIKFLAPELLQNEQQVDGFRREAELLARVRNPYVAQVREYRQDGGQAAIVMEAVNGVSLRKLLNEHGRLAPEAALVVLKGSLLGLDAAHQLGIVHRDYKPANVMVQEDGQSKLIDFGVAALAGERSMSGTPAYMAPEQWKQEDAVPATDVYAATCVFYECVTGHQPFRARTVVEMAARHLQASVPLENVPEALHQIVSVGMAKEPRNRPPRASVFVEWLDRIASNAYGDDWESRGLAALAAGVATLAALLPLALLVSSGTGQAGTSVATTVLSSGTGKGGLLAKVGGGKAAAAGTGVLAVGAVGWLVLSGPDVGGTSSASYEQWFANASLITGNQSIPQGSKAGPGVRYRLSVNPARATRGTRVALRVSYEAKATWGLEYLSEGNYRCHDPDGTKTDAYHQSYSVGTNTKDQFRETDNEVWLYPASRTAGLPTATSTTKISAKLSVTEKEQFYRSSECAWIMPLEGVFTFTLPENIRPGNYLISAFNPPGLVSSTRRGSTDVPLESAGLRTEGELPRFTVLD